MHCLAQNFAQQLKAKIEKKGLTQLFGETMQYGDIYILEKKVMNMSP